MPRARGLSLWKPVGDTERRQIASMWNVAEQRMEILSMAWMAPALLFTRLTSDGRPLLLKRDPSTQFAFSASGAFATAVLWNLSLGGMSCHFDFISAVEVTVLPCP